MCEVSGVEDVKKGKTKHKKLWKVSVGKNRLSNNRT